MGCFGGESYTVAPQDQVVNNQLAALSREQYQDYVNRFRPLEIEAITDNVSDTGIKERIGKTRAGANQAWDSARGTSDRALSDYGVSLDADQKATRDRMYKQNRSASVADSVNLARGLETDRRYEVGNNLMATGRQVEGTASGQYSAAAQLEAARGRANAQAKTAASQAGADQDAELAGTLASIAMFAFMSDEELKHKIADVSDEQALRDVKAIDVKSYNYKPGAGLPKDRKVGGMKDDMPDYVKRPDGMVDVQSSIGMLTSAVKALDKKIQSIQPRAA